VLNAPNQALLPGLPLTTARMGIVGVCTACAGGPDILRAMSEVWYMVTATLPDEDTRDRYVEWLGEGHLDQVIRGGATTARLVRVDEPSAPLEVASVYTFASREAFDLYVRNHAPRLRAEGLARFGPETGVAFRRQVGTILT
jgi:hypothetical protein